LIAFQNMQIIFPDSAFGTCGHRRLRHSSRVQATVHWHPKKSSARHL
jgi:hypothetical protein